MVSAVSLCLLAIGLTAVSSHSLPSDADYLDVPPSDRRTFSHKKPVKVLPIFKKHKKFAAIVPHQIFGKAPTTEVIYQEAPKPVYKVHRYQGIELKPVTDLSYSTPEPIIETHSIEPPADDIVHSFTSDHSFIPSGPGIPFFPENDKPIFTSPPTLAPLPSPVKPVISFVPGPPQPLFSSIPIPTPTFSISIPRPAPSPVPSFPAVLASVPTAFQPSSHQPVPVSIPSNPLPPIPLPLPVNPLPPQPILQSIPLKVQIPVVPPVPAPSPAPVFSTVKIPGPPQTILAAPPQVALPPPPQIAIPAPTQVSIPAPPQVALPAPSQVVLPPPPQVVLPAPHPILPSPPPAPVLPSISPVSSTPAPALPPVSIPVPPVHFPILPSPLPPLQDFRPQSAPAPPEPEFPYPPSGTPPQPYIKDISLGDIAIKDTPLPTVESHKYEDVTPTIADVGGKDFDVNAIKPGSGFFHKIKGWKADKANTALNFIHFKPKPSTLDAHSSQAPLGIPAPQVPSFPVLPLPGPIQPLPVGPPSLFFPPPQLYSPPRYESFPPNNIESPPPLLNSYGVPIPHDTYAPPHASHDRLSSAASEEQPSVVQAPAEKQEENAEVQQQSSQSPFQPQGILQEHPIYVPEDHKTVKEEKKTTEDVESDAASEPNPQGDAPNALKYPNHKE